MLREAAVIEFLAKDIEQKMKLTVNPDSWLWETRPCIRE